MQIDSELLSIKNYTGHKFIEIKSYQVKKLQKQIAKIGQAAKPILDEMDKVQKEKLDSFYIKLQEHQQAMKEIQTNPDFVAAKEEYDTLLKRVELKDNQAQLLQNKMRPIVDAEIEGKLGEFEKPVQLVTKDGKIMVEVIDELEEWLKVKRNANLNHKS